MSGNELAAKIDALAAANAAGFAALTARLEALEAGQASGAARLDALTARPDALRGDLMARMDRLQDALMEQRKADVVNYGAPQQAARIAARTRDETREDVRSLTVQVDAMYRIIQRLQSEVRELRGEP